MKIYATLSNIVKQEYFVIALNKVSYMFLTRITYKDKFF
jgi:hypothetical protein